MKSLFVLLLTFLFPLPVMAQDVIKLWPDAAIPNAIAGKRIVEKSTTEGGILRISDVMIPTLTAYPAVAGKATGAAIMICPGGGYSILAASHEGSDMAQWFAERGITAFVLKYRLPNEQIMTHREEVPLRDAIQGMKLIRQQAAKYGIDPTKIGVMGFSAGGHLASTLSTHYFRAVGEQGTDASDLSKPNFAVLLYPVVTFGDKTHGGSRERLLGKTPSSEQIAYYSNELQVTNQTPPTLLVHSMDDKTVPVENSVNYYLALKNAGIPAEMHLYPTGGHGYGLRTAGQGSLANWPAACEGWLKGMGYMK